MLGYLTRNYEKGLVYDGTNLNEVLDGQDSLKFKRDNPDFKVFTIPNLYGKPYSFKFPSYDLKRSDVTSKDSGWKDITYSWYEKVIELSNLGYINDYTLGAHKALTDTFDIFVKVLSGGDELYTLIQKENVQLQEELESEDPDVVAQAIEKANKFKHRSSGVEGELILMKEAIMGYEQADPIIFRPSKKSTPKSFTIGQDYDFKLPIADNQVFHIKNNYTAALRYQMLHKALDERNTNPRYKLHQRSNLLQRRQTDAMKRMARRTVLLCPRRCVQEDTLIRLDNGEYKKAKDVTKNDVLFGGKKIKELIHGKMPSYKITLNNGMELIVSENHRVPTSLNYDNIKGWDLKEDNYKTPKDLKKGDFLPVNFSEPGPKPHAGNMGFMAGFIYGMLMGDGDRNNHSIAIHYDSVRNHFINRVNKNKFPYTISTKGYIRLSQKNKFIWEDDVLKEYSFNKHIPLNKYSMSNEWKWGFVEGMLITDGSLSKSNHEIEYCSTSKELVIGLQLMLLDLGVFSSVTKKHIKTKFKSSTNNIAYTLHISDNKSLKTILSYIDLSCKKNYKELYNIVFNDLVKHTSFKNVIPLHAFKQHTEKGFMVYKPRCGKAVRVRGEEEITQPSYNFQRYKCNIYGLQGWLKYYWVQIKSIEKIEGELPVVDFEVDGDHTFNANGIQTHNSGKTIIVALEILKEMLAHNYKQATRPRSVIFISKDFDAVSQVMDYITSLINEFDWLKSMFNYNSTDHIFSLDTFDENGKKKTIAQCKFYSALGKMPAVGDAADAVFFDEAMLYPKNVFDKIYPIVMNEGARMLIVSTFYSPSDDGDRVYDRPIKLCNEYEKESSKIIDIDKHIITLWKEKERTGIIPDECAGLRYTIDDVEVIINKEQVKASLQDEPDRYMRELYCRATEANSVLNYKPYIAQVRYNANPYPHYESGPLGPEAIILKPKFKRIVAAYDPAQTSDISAFVAVGYDESRNKLCVIKEWGLNFKDKSSYIPQAKLIKEALKHLEMFNCPILKCADSNHPGVIDAMRGQRVFFQYLYVWGGGDVVRKGVRSGETRVPKNLMVEAAQMLFDNGMVEIWDSDCKQLIEQLSNFVEFKNEYTQKSRFKGARGHDDFVDCLLYCLWTFWAHLGLSHNKFQVDSFTEYAMQQQEDNDPLHLLDDPNNTPRAKYETVSNAFWY